ncbi:hypothetical protein [Butyrivibrio sp.]|jgi:hypothetical protein|uniref:hypothetical protein n=1 Tax=Butyrivibrio sp. TaxID=28121 RepID=UPI0025B80175|nr:hypothetical protein [Butyrivibrio sp.]
MEKEFDLKKMDELFVQLNETLEKTDVEVGTEIADATCGGGCSGMGGYWTAPNLNFPR